MAVVLQISDTHLCAVPGPRPQGDPDAALQATVDALRDTPADLVVLTGDLADDGSQDALRRVHDIVDGLDVPIVAIAGNHDVPGNVRVVFGEARITEVGAWRVVPVDTVIPGCDDGAVDVAGVESCLDVLDHRPTMIVMHHPPRSPSTHPWFQLRGADELMDSLARRPHVRLIASGHLHQDIDITEGAVRIRGAPSTLYAIKHQGSRYRLVDGGLVGAQRFVLDDDGALSFACVPRS